ncbi:MAG TPA: 5-deoxy-glucuronate isomerase [Solirubrobacteraceae bacterium]|jgi:5-deoxy-glucuronate isomerase|nr:5-deoxy-glucuronate isomerase [Solirubrobacteraceae bacterium]
MRTLVKAGEQTAHINLSLADLAAGESLELPADGETAAVVLRGRVDAAAAGTPLGTAGGRDSVFEGPGDTVYAPPGTALRLTALDGGPVQLAIANAAATTASPTLAGDLPPARVITPADQRIAEVGEGNWSRTVRTILGPEHGAVRMLLGETINPPGNWSSYPPHRHDRHDPPREVNLEEVYLFKVDPPEGFGVQIRYELDGDRAEEAFVVRTDDVATIRSGFHPVVAASGYTLYYLWVMAGEGREPMPFFDPAHAWVQNGR